MNSKVHKQFKDNKKKKGFNKKVTAKEIIKKGSNDISWYNKNPILSKIAGLVNFLRAIGSKFDLNDSPNLVETITETTSQGDQVFIGTPRSIPGVMALTWMPMLGACKSAIDAVNLAMAKFFTKLREKNFSLSNYDGADVMFYFLAVDSLFAMHAFLVMIYTHAKNFFFENKYSPKAILKAMNVDYNDIIQHLDEFLFYINVCKERLSVVRVPKSIKFIARHMHMSAHVYKDSELEKCQYYVFVPQSLNKYDATTPSLDPVNIGADPTPLTFASLKSKFDSMLDAVLPDEGMNMIAADVAKYFETDYWSINDIDWNTMDQPVYDKEMLWQIHNADFLPYVSATGLSVIQRVTPNLDTIVVHDPVFTTNEPGINGTRILDSDSAAPSPEEVIESTRFKFTITGVSGTTTPFTFHIKSCGSEILTNGKILIYDPYEDDYKEVNFTQFIRSDCLIGTVPGRNLWVFDAVSKTVGTKTNWYFGSDLASLLSVQVFADAPLRYLCMIGSSAQNVGKNMIMQIVGSLNNVAKINDEQIEALNEQCLLSMFDL